MIGLKGVRVLVVDDEESDALPVMKAFAQKGIGCAFFNGSVEGLPKESERLSGIRLAILDMDLVGGGVADKSKVTTLVSRVEALLSPMNGPYVVLAWTRHPELIKLFEEYMFSRVDAPKPIITVSLTKDQCITNGEFDLKVLGQKINEALSTFSPLQFLQAWEEKNFEAATEVTNILSNLILQETDPAKWRLAWKNQLLNLMYALAKESVGESLDEHSVLIGVYNSLNPLHSDRMESYISDLSVLLSGSAAEILGQKEECGIDRKAMINTMLHLASEKDGKYAAGNIYRFEGENKPSWVPSCEELLGDFLKKEYNKLEQKQELSLKCQPILIEISATCDHAQKNIRVARFLAGLLIPVSEQNKIKQPAEFIWRLGPLLVGGLPSPYFLCLSARHLVTSSLGDVVSMKSFARLRNQPLIHLQAWFARHASRPGLILLEG